MKAQIINYEKYPTAVLKNEEMEVWISSLGATILKLLVKDKAGKFQDVVLGYEHVEDYKKYKGYLGAVVGRVANRIAKGKFTLNGIEYQLPVNNGPNCNHGGMDGFAFSVFDLKIQDEKALFSLVSKDKDEGFPGTMQLQVAYSLKKSTLNIEYTAFTDADTIVNITNHSYFNLDGEPSYIGNQYLCVDADYYGESDLDGLVTGKLLGVDHTAFDFRNWKKIEEALNSRDQQIQIGNGLDHPFILNKEKTPVKMYSSKTGIYMEVETTLPQAQIYSANYLNNERGKNGKGLAYRSGICFETQNMPNDINLHPQNSVTILRKGDIYKEKTSFRFSVK